jgi:PH/SEC7 domain-containing protein
MSRNQFVRNTLAAIQMQLQPLAPCRAPSFELTNDDSGSLPGGAAADTAGETTSTSRSKRSSSIVSWKTASKDALTPVSGYSSPAAQLSSPHINSSVASVQIPSGQESKGANPSSASSSVYGKQWENDMETLLKVSPS